MRSIPKAGAILGLGLLAACSSFYEDNTVRVREAWPVAGTPMYAAAPMGPTCAAYPLNSVEYRICSDRARRAYGM
jgi:hypothetical protein